MHEVDQEDDAIAVSVQMGATIVPVGLGLRFVNLLVQQRVSEVAADEKPTIR